MDQSTLKQLVSLEAALLAAPMRPLFSSPSWADDVPEAPGVYAVWDRHKGTVVYVGETTCLRDRMTDLGRWANHTCRRKLAKKHRWHRMSASDMSAALGKRYGMSFLTVPFGRLELEEYLSLRWKESLVNSPSKRVLRSGYYEHVERAKPTMPPG